MVDLTSTDRDDSVAKDNEKCIEEEKSKNKKSQKGFE
jgi:hypothetical protein